MAAPRLSVIVPVYRVEEYLARCVDSILAQTFSDFELILVDDGSPDRCGALCEDYAARDKRVRVVHKENGGLSSARNAGLDIARGEWIAFVDSDDYLRQDCYETLLSCAERNGVRLVCAGRFDVSQKRGTCDPGLCPPREEKISGEELARRIFTWQSVDSAAWDKLYGAELFAGMRYPEGVTSEDVPVTYRLALLAGEAAMCPERVYYYFHRAGSITYTNISKKTFCFSRHTHAIAQSMRNNPALADAARYFNAWALCYNLKRLSQADASARRCFSEVYQTSRRELLAELPFLLRCGYASGRMKLEAVLLASGLYRPLQSAYARLRGRA